MRIISAIMNFFIVLCYCCSKTVNKKEEDVECEFLTCK